MNPSLTDNKKRCSIVAVDGPAGSGKSSVCQKVCQLLNWNYVNTGFLYRTLAHLAIDRQLDTTILENLAELTTELEKKLLWIPDSGKVVFDDKDISPYLYSDITGNKASEIAKVPSLRTKLLPLQRQLSLQASSGSIVDGRDIGTVVFPDADLKIYMTASLMVRAKRRLLQLHNGNEEEISSELVAATAEQMAKRDKQDSGREAAPLRKADDAIEIDTSHHSADQVCQQLIGLIREKGLSKV